MKKQVRIFSISILINLCRNISFQNKQNKDTIINIHLHHCYFVLLKLFFTLFVEHCKHIFWKLKPWVNVRLFLKSKSVVEPCAKSNTLYFVSYFHFWFIFINITTLPQTIIDLASAIVYLTLFGMGKNIMYFCRYLKDFKCFPKQIYCIKKSKILKSKKNAEFEKGKSPLWFEHPLSQVMSTILRLSQLHWHISITVNNFYS